MDLTIVIVSFKSGDILHRCIKSIDKKYPIIVVENSQNFKLKEELEKKYSNLECILPEKNLGYGAGNNLGIKNSKTKYVLTLNPDTILYESTISKLLEQANKIEDFALLGPKVISDKENMSNTDSKIKEVSYIKGFAIFFNKEKFNNIGYFDENYFLYFEEIDLCKKVIKSKNKIYLINNALKELERNNKIKSVSQNEEKATYAKKIKPEETKIDWNKSGIEILRQIKAIGGWFKLGNERIKIFDAKISNIENKSSGIILDKNFSISCGNNNVINPTILQKSGGTKMGIHEFLRGFEFKINQKIN